MDGTIGRETRAQVGIEATDEGYTFEFDPTVDDLVVRLSLVFEALTGTPVTELEPLGAYVDTDALVHFFADATVPREKILVRFDYVGYTVELTGTHKGRILA